MTVSATCSLVRFGDLRIEHWPDDTPLVRNLMQSPAWLCTETEVYGQGDDTLALITGPADNPDALAVLGRQSSGGLRLLGGVDVGECVEVLYRDDPSLKRLAQGFASLRRAVDFGHYPTNSGMFHILKEALGKRGVVLQRPMQEQASPVLELDASWTDPLSHFSRSRRQSMRRKQRKAEAMGELSIDITTPDPTEVDALYDRFVAVEAQSWKGPAGTALLHDQRQADFFRRFGHRMAQQRALRLCFLTIGGTDAAAEFAVEWKDRFWSIKLGYDEKFSAVSPGELLRLELVSKAAGQGQLAVEFCGKDAAWTRGWTEHATQIAALRLYPFTPGGAIVFARDGAALAIRRLRNRLPM